MHHISSLTKSYFKALIFSLLTLVRYLFINIAKRMITALCIKVCNSFNGEPEVRDWRFEILRQSCNLRCGLVKSGLINWRDSADGSAMYARDRDLSAECRSRNEPHCRTADIGRASAAIPVRYLTTPSLVHFLLTVRDQIVSCNTQTVTWYGITNHDLFTKA